MYQIEMSKKILGVKTKPDVFVIPNEYYLAHDANIKLMEYAEAQREVWPLPAYRVDHHAGQSVAYYKGGRYTEYTRIPTTKRPVHCPQTV